MQQVVSRWKVFPESFTLKVKGKLVCQWRQVCQICSFLVKANSKMNVLRNFALIVTKSNHQAIFAAWFHWSIARCQQVFVRFPQCTQDLVKCDGSFEHVPNLICVQQACSKCEVVDDLIVDLNSIGKRTHMFWQDPVGKFIISGCPDRSG